MLSAPVTQAAGWQGPGGGQCQAQRAKPSVVRPFCRSSPMTHWTHPGALPFGAVPSFGFNASRERAGLDQMEAEWVPQRGPSRLGLI